MKGKLNKRSQFTAAAIAKKAVVLQTKFNSNKYATFFISAKLIMSKPLRFDISTS